MKRFFMCSLIFWLLSSVAYGDEIKIEHIHLSTLSIKANGMTIEQVPQDVIRYLQVGDSVEMYGTVTDEFLSDMNLLHKELEDVKGRNEPICETPEYRERCEYLKSYERYDSQYRASNQTDITARRLAALSASRIINISGLTEEEVRIKIKDWHKEISEGRVKKLEERIASAKPDSMIYKSIDENFLKNVIAMRRKKSEAVLTRYKALSAGKIQPTDIIEAAIRVGIISTQNDIHIEFYPNNNFKTNPNGNYLGDNEIIRKDDDDIFHIRADGASRFSYLTNPLLTNPPISGNDQYVLWPGSITQKRGSHYIVDRGATFRSRIRYFMIEDIKHSFIPLSFNTQIYVIGRYAGTTDIELVSGEVIPIPVLRNCYTGAYH